MNDDPEPPARMTDFIVRAGQITIFVAVMFGCIYFEQSTGYHLNPWLIGVWSFMAAYGATALATYLLDRRVRYGRIFPRLRRN